MLPYKELLSLINQDHDAHSKRIYILLCLLCGLDHFVYMFSYKCLRLVASLPLLLDSVSIETIAISSQPLLLDRFDIIQTLG